MKKDPDSVINDGLHSKKAPKTTGGTNDGGYIWVG
jgi:hypothetical protein